MAEATEASEELPAWSMPASALARSSIAADWPAGVTREWAFGGSTGAGVRVCVVDSGVDRHPPEELFRGIWRWERGCDREQ